jgi:tRNA threonylcarbamoyladenosine biosynthesis protein TsaB
VSAAAGHTIATLAIDTSTEALGLALEGRGVSLSVSLRVGYRHAETLVPWIERLLREADMTARELELLVVAIGPGSFTGLRIGLATAKGLAAGSGCAIVGIPTLDAWAWRHRAFPGIVVPVMDARKRRLYAGIYRSGERQGDLLDISQTELLARLSGLAPPLLLTGPFASRIAVDPTRAELPFTPSVDPLHAASAPLGLLSSGRAVYKREGSHGDGLVPLYLRGSEAEVKRRGES